MPLPDEDATTSRRSRAVARGCRRRLRARAARFASEEQSSLHRRRGAGPTRLVKCAPSSPGRQRRRPLCVCSRHRRTSARRCRLSCGSFDVALDKGRRFSVHIAQVAVAAKGRASGCDAVQEKVAEPRCRACAGDCGSKEARRAAPSATTHEELAEIATSRGEASKSAASKDSSCCRRPPRRPPLAHGHTAPALSLPPAGTISLHPMSFADAHGSGSSSVPDRRRRALGRPLTNNALGAVVGADARHRAVFGGVRVRAIKRRSSAT